MKITYIYHRQDRAFWDHCTVSPKCLDCVSYPSLGQAWECTHSLHTCACLSLFVMNVQQLGCFLWACTTFPAEGERMQGEGSAFTFTHLCQGWLFQGQADTAASSAARASREFALEPWIKNWPINILLCLAGDCLWVKPAVRAVWRDK